MSAVRLFGHFLANPRTPLRRADLLGSKVKGRAWFSRVRLMSCSGLIAICQLTSTQNKEANFQQCSQLIREARKGGVEMVFLPEGFDYIGSSVDETLNLSEPLNGPLLKRYSSLARELGVWISLGGFHERGEAWETDRKIYNSHILLDNSGEAISVYRKTHLFDANVHDEISVVESSFTSPGNSIGPPVTTPIGKVGLGICYDLRFPEFSMALVNAGAEILTYPSAFTDVTGRAHWEVLLRARAIETQSYVVAAAQTGRHNPRRVSHGHSLVVDPWGEILCDAGTMPGFRLVLVDGQRLRSVREKLPVLRQRRFDLYGTCGGSQRAREARSKTESESEGSETQRECVRERQREHEGESETEPHI